MSQTLWFLEAALISFMTAGFFGSFSHLSFLYIHLAVIAVFGYTQVPRVMVQRDQRDVHLGSSKANSTRSVETAQP
jgi:hypothetical protein